MEKVVRVSIANSAFILEEEAYRILDTYLNELKIHYSTYENGSEIIDGIEERLADLFSERIPGGSVVPAATAGEVVALLGRPSDIDREAGDLSTGNQGRPVVKRLYRNPDRRVLGGVCGGLSAYFNMDVVWIRLIFVGIFMLSTFWSSYPYCFMVLFSYIILWFIVPKARTVEQKYAMRGEAFSVSGIERNVETEGNFRSGTPNSFWEGVGRVVVFCIGILLTVCGISGIIGFMAAFSGLHIFHNSFEEAVQVMLNQSGTLFLILKSALLLVAFLPFVGMLYTGIQLLFKFKSPKWRPGLVVFLLWIVLLLITTALSIYSFSHYFNSQYFSRQETVAARDTIYIKYDRLEQWKDDRLALNAGRWSYSFALLDHDEKAGLQMITWPFVYLLRDTAHHDLTLNSRTRMFNDMVKGNELKEVMDLRFYRMEGDTLYLDPLLYNKENGIKETGRQIMLHIRPETKVIVEKPVPHRFEKRFEHNNWLGLLPNY